MEVQEMIKNEKAVVPQLIGSDSIWKYAPKSNELWLIHDTGTYYRSLTVNVETPGHGSVALRVDPLGTVRDIKEQLQAEVAIPLANQCLMKNDDVLRDESTLFDCRITQGSVLQVIEEKQVELSVHTPDGKMLPMRVCNTDTVYQIIETIARKEDITNANLLLLQKGSPLSGMKMLHDYDINQGHEEVLELVVGDGPISVHIRNIGGKYFTILVEVTDLVGDVKSKFQETEGIPCDQQRLFFGGKHLIDDCALSYYNIINGATLHLRLRLRGGAPPLYVLDKKGRSVYIEVYSHDTVNDVKARIEKTLGIPPEQQELVIYDERIMENRTDNSSAEQSTFACHIV